MRASYENGAPVVSHSETAGARDLENGALPRAPVNRASKTRFVAKKAKRCTIRAPFLAFGCTVSHQQPARAPVHSPLGGCTAAGCGPSNMGIPISTDGRARPRALEPGPRNLGRSCTVRRLNPVVNRRLLPPKTGTFVSKFECSINRPDLVGYYAKSHTGVALRWHSLPDFLDNARVCRADQRFLEVLDVHDVSAALKRLQGLSHILDAHHQEHVSHQHPLGLPCGPRR